MRHRLGGVCGGVKPPTTIDVFPKPARGLAAGANDTGLPSFSVVLTCDNARASIDRAGLKGGQQRFLKLASPPSRWPTSRKLGVAGKSPVAATKLSRRRKLDVNNMPSLRTESREFPMQMLFQWDMSQQDPAKLEAKFWRAAKSRRHHPRVRQRLFEGAAKESPSRRNHRKARGKLALRTSRAIDRASSA